jgi:methionyl aminopeptidase
VIAGNPKSPKHVQLLETTERALTAGICAVNGKVRTGDIAAAVQAVLQPAGYGIVRDLVGHGVGDEVHEEPNVPNYGRKHTGERLSKGQTIAIEPMATLGGYDVFIMPDGWTIKTRDGSLAAHFEHTVAVTEDGYVIMTEL